MKLLVDMNLSPRWVAVLRDGGFDVKHWSDLGDSKAPDREIMAYARDNGFVVLTQDLDFGAILAATGGKEPSVVQLRASDIDPSTIAAHVVASLSKFKAELEAGALLTIDISRSRVRLLPLIARGE